MFEISRFVISAERKYCSGTSSSKMSDNEHTLPILGDSKSFAGKHLPFHIVPQFVQGSEDGLERSSSVVIEEPFDVFKE